MKVFFFIGCEIGIVDDSPRKRRKRDSVRKKAARESVGNLFQEKFGRKRKKMNRNYHNDP